MTAKQLTVSVGSHTFPVFLQRGFFNTGISFTPVHKHRYTEVHLIWGCDCQYLVGEKHVVLHSGQALLVPPETFHECITGEPQGKHLAFQLSAPLNAVTKKNLPSGIVSHLIETVEAGADPGKISAAIGFICGEIFEYPESFKPLRDPGFIIHERLANEYADDLTLSDLAEELKLSNKQTERLIVKYTGSTFRKELTRRRIEAARHLIETEEISLAEAAERVGYKSYSGFWKAFRGEKK